LLHRRPPPLKSRWQRSRPTKYSIVVVPTPFWLQRQWPHQQYAGLHCPAVAAEVFGVERFILLIELLQNRSDERHFELMDAVDIWRALRNSNLAPSRPPMLLGSWKNSIVLTSLPVGSYIFCHHSVSSARAWHNCAL